MLQLCMRWQMFWPLGCAEKEKNHGFYFWTSVLWCVMIILMRIKSQNLEFQTASQSEIDLKIAKRSQYGNFNLV